MRSGLGRSKRSLDQVRSELNRSVRFDKLFNSVSFVRQPVGEHAEHNLPSVFSLTQR